MMSAPHRGPTPDWQRRILANYDWLVDNLTGVPELVDDCIAQEALSPRDRKAVRNDGADEEEENKLFLSLLLEKGSGLYAAFIKALTREKTKLTTGFIAEKLESTDLNSFTENDLKTAWDKVNLSKTLGPKKQQGPIIQNVQHVTKNYIGKAQNIFMCNDSSAGFLAAGAQDTRGTDSNLLPESLLIALIREVLFHCPQKKEAMCTLEEKVCEKMRETKRDIASFIESCGISFKDFVSKHKDHFRLSMQKSIIIVERVSVLTPYLSPSSAPSSPPQTKTGSDAVFNSNELTATRRLDFYNKNQDKALEIENTSVKQSMTSQTLARTGDLLTTGDRRITGDTQVTEPKTPWEETEETSPPPQSRYIADSSVASLLMREANDVLVFKLSPDAYMNDNKQFTIDIVSLWNTPDRDKAFIVLGIKPLMSVPHQLVGLNGSKSNKYYQQLFFGNIFDFKPKFSYREVTHEGKLVGIIEVENSAGSAAPTLVTSDKKKPRLTKNQLWTRKDGRNVQLNGADMNNPDVQKIQSWVMRSPSTHHPQPNLPYEQPGARCSKPGSAAFKGTKTSDEMPAGVFNRNETGVSGKGRKNGTENPEADLTTELVGASRRSSASLDDDDDDDQSDELGSRSREPGKVTKTDLMKALSNFDRGHFVLLCGTLTNTVPNLDVLSLAPWIAVFDFDPNGRDTGLLGRMEVSLKNTRSTIIRTWMDHDTGVTERGTQWWSLRGRVDVPDSNLSDLSPLNWIRKVRDKVDKVCAALERFCEVYTVLNILVLWPNSKEEAECMHTFLRKVLERIKCHPSIFLWFTDPSGSQEDSSEAKNIIAFAEGNVHMFRQDLGAFCAEVGQMFDSSLKKAKFTYKLPTEDEQSPAEIVTERVAWLKEDFEVLYLGNPYSSTQLTADDLRAEGDNFFKGGSISWVARYDMGSSCFDVERGDLKEITNHIKTVFIKPCSRGIVQILHAPGSGGSTMSQRILFNLHELVPCVHINQQSGSSYEKVAERLRYLYDTTHAPVVALVDGMEEQKLRSLQLQLRGVAVIFLFVKRYTHRMRRLSIPHRSTFFLKGIVTKQESRNLACHLTVRCNRCKEKEKALNDLDWEVQNGVQNHQMFEYGMTVYEHEFRGVTTYVKGYLQISESEGTGLNNLNPWQRCLGYLSLVFYYAHSSLPCSFVGTLMGKESNRFLSIRDLPYYMRVFVVPDDKEKENYVRIMHYTVAVEILEQILNPRGKRSGNEKLSERAKCNLKQFCLSFLEQIVNGGDGSSQVVQSVLTKTFILRETSKAVDPDLETNSKKVNRFSEVILDLDSREPYNGRLEVFKKLCEACPTDANLTAHLGRFYSLCQPEKVEEAENSFKEAVKLADQDSTNDSTDQPLVYIYHMYGCFIQRKINRLRKSASTYPISEITDDGNQACDKFQQCRSHAPPDIIEDIHFINDIDTRLAICEHICKYAEGGLKALIHSSDELKAEFLFVRECIIEIQDLIMECHNLVFMNDAALIDLQYRVRRYNALFRGCVQELQALTSDDPLTSLRLKVAAKKLQYDQPDNPILVQNPHIPPDVLECVVGILECIFEHRDNPQMKTKLDLDYLDWILAIRNRNFQPDYTIERVLESVRQWNTSLHTSQSAYYLFVLLSLLGMGTKTTPENPRCLKEALEVRDSMRNLGRADPKARPYPSEWLGRDEMPGIRRLVPHIAVPLENHKIQGTAKDHLALCKGTVVRRSRKASVDISLELKDKSVSVKVFFVPARSDTGGSSFMQGSRVQFYLGFSQENGYEAFEVTFLKKVQCPDRVNCGHWMEIKSDETSVPCQGRKTSSNSPICGREIFYRH